jgi:hypothetical protein
MANVTKSVATQKHEELIEKCGVVRPRTQMWTWLRN